MINKFVFLPPQSDLFAEWIPRLLDSAPGWDIVAPETEAEARLELADADAAFGTMTPELIACAPNLRWLQAPAAAPDAGYYFDELIAHQTKVTNFREIYNDHISVQILTYILSFTKHSHLYRDFQQKREWRTLDAPHHEIFLPESTVLIIEIRTYICHSGKLNDLNSRFRNHTNQFFVKHGMQFIGYWMPQDKKDTLIYILAFPSLEARSKSWDDFRNDENWTKVYKESRKNGPIVKEIISQLMDPTDYSPIR